MKISGEIQYLTEKQKNFYLVAISEGKEYVVLPDGRVLASKFTFIEPADYRDTVEKLELGKWECESGVWHTQGVKCYCKDEYEELEDGRLRLKEKN